MDIEQINSIYDINLELVKKYLRIDEEIDDDDLELSLYIKSVISYLENYVDESCVEDASLIVPALMLIANCYENKEVLDTSNSRMNEVFERFLWMQRGLVL